MDLAVVEIELARTDNHLTAVRSAIENSGIAEHFDYCLIDTPPSLGVLMTASLAAADEILIPLQCEWFGLEGLAKIVNVIEQIQGSGANPHIQLHGILMTMYDARTNLSKAVVEEVGKYFPTIKIGEAPSHAKTIFEHDRWGIGALAYESAAEEFLKRQGDFPDGTK